MTTNIVSPGLSLRRRYRPDSRRTGQPPPLSRTGEWTGTFPWLGSDDALLIDTSAFVVDRGIAGVYVAPR